MDAQNGFYKLTDCQLIFIVGMQKSGTNLMKRLLLHSGIVESPGKGEFQDLWGNRPYFSPTAFPAGTIYQKYHGLQGHQINVDEATMAVQEVLQERLAAAISGKKAAILNKSPYNSVRLPWLRALFPNSFIVAMVRQPLSNLFSLLKKFIPHDRRRTAPEDGWWGVKPARWQEMVSEKKVIQCAYQWEAVNQKLWHDRAYIDMVVSYQQLCEQAQKLVELILSRALKRPILLPAAFPVLKCFNEEYQHGAALRSKNSYYRPTGNRFDIPSKENIELLPLTEQEVVKIREICDPTALALQSLLLGI